MTCPLCTSVTELWFIDSRRSYNRCNVCALVFVPIAEHLSASAEKAEYDLHQNDPTDEGYRQFLRRLATPLIARLPVRARGLDFGCGPGPALVMMLEDAGYSCEKYDVFYFPCSTVLAQQYNFICMTEVVEHLAHPESVLNQLWSRLLPGGILAIMTKRVIDLQAFSRWHYKNDMTHVAFFSEETFQYLARHWSASIEFIDKDVVFLIKH